MKRNSGWFAGLLMLLTLFGVSNLPKISEGADARNPKTPPAAKKASPSAPPASAACTEIANRLWRFAEKEPVPPQEWELPESCYETGEAPPAAQLRRALPYVSFAIATVPNPVATHLPLSFDRILEAIQQAAQDESYSYDDSWLPWDTKEYTSLSDQRTAERLQSIQQEQPGVMVFRQELTRKTDPPPYLGGLIVFLVGENPTGGIDGKQFRNALAWINQLRGISDESPLRILGPSFSGSLPSLRQALERAPATLVGYSIQPEIHVSSGTVSAGSDYQWFATWIATQRDGSFFRTAMENDRLMTDRFCQYLGEQGYPIKNVAFLSEDETAFGSEADDVTTSPCAPAVQLSYPRDIATLRSAYEQQSILSPAKPQPSTNAPATTLRGDLSEPSRSDHDTVRSYGGQLTPMAQEAVLLDITNRLSEKQIQFIVLRSTNSLDQIFLSEFLRRSYPEGRIVIDGADLLFTRGAEGRSLRGVMVLSTYPQLMQGQDWTKPLLTVRGRAYRTFGADFSESVYIAARELFRNRDPRVPIYNYTAPSWAVRQGEITDKDWRPSTWLTVIGRRQFWPLAVLNSKTLRNLPESAAKSILKPSGERGDGIPKPDPTSPPLMLPTTLWLFVIACAAWSGLHLFFCWRGSTNSVPRALAYFAPIPQRQHGVLIALGSLMPAMLAVTVAATSGLLSWRESAHLYGLTSEVLLMVCVLSTLAFSVVACARNYRLTPSRAAGSPIKPLAMGRFGGGAAALLCLALFILVQIYLIHLLTDANRVPTYWRSVNLLSGVSPLLPQALLLAGAYLWFWCTLRGLAHLGDDRPVLPLQEELPKLDPDTSMMPMFSREGAQTPIEHLARPLTGRYFAWLGSIFGICAAVSGIALQPLLVRTLGERQFGILVFLWISLCIAVVITDAFEMWRAWTELRQLLVHLDRLPLRRTLRALQGLAWGSIWKLSGNVLEERYRVISFQLESLRHLTNTVTEWAPDWLSASAGNRTAVLSQATKCRNVSLTFITWYVKNISKSARDLTPLQDLQRELASTAGLLLVRILLPAWRKEEQSLILDCSKPKSESGDAKGDKTSIPTESRHPHVQAAEEFVVLLYLAFIQNILGRLRTIALGGLWLFVGATLAVSSYPFDPLSVLGGIFLVVFLIDGAISILVYSQMSRDATLSHITNTQPGELGGEFWTRLVAFGAGPLIGLLTTLFPSIADFIFSWLQPSVQALK